MRNTPRIRRSSVAAQAARVCRRVALFVAGANACLLFAQLPAPRLEMSFAEASGLSTTNSGVLGGVAVFAQQSGFPVFSARVPVGLFAPSGNTASVDLGEITSGQGGRAIDLTTAGGSLGSLAAFTVCGWVNARSLVEGPGGNRIAFALAAQNGPGFDLVQLASGALRIGINQWPDGSGGGGPISSSGRITADPSVGSNNWVFLAVTYDSALPSNHLKYYFGKADQAATLDSEHTYARGAAGPCGAFTAGNFSVVDTGARQATGTSSRVFRGLMDELRVFNRALTLAEIRAVQAAPAFRPVDLPPEMAQVVPMPGGTARRFEQIEVVFTEAVAGVDAADLLVNGMPATNVVAVAPDDYVFSFPAPPTGVVAVAWAPTHGIHDLGDPPNAFAGAAWTNVFDPHAALQPPRITEFMAENKRTLNDEEGDSSDWIEIHNPDIEAVNLEGYFLTDSTNIPAKWRFPSVVLGPNAYLVVFASEKNRTNPAAPLHTNFKLEKSGEYLALLNPETNEVSAFGPRYPVQREDVSFGRDRLLPELTGYFAVPTPGRPNSTSGAGFAPEVRFSHSSGPFTAPFLLTLSTPDTNATIHYLLVQDAASAADTNVPSPTSPVYTNALLITNTVHVRARAFAPGLLPGAPGSETYVAFHTNVMRASSDLPLLVVHTLGGGDFNQTALKTAHLSVFEPVLGRTSFSNAPAVTTRAALRVRGNTSASSAKKSWTMETWDEFNDDKDVSLLGMPAESDWVLYGPASMEPVMIHNPFAYELARSLGQYAPRTRFVELYLNTSGGMVTPSHYHGVYILVEKIKIAPGRIEGPRLEPEISSGPALTGTYLMQVDRREAGETGLQIPPVQAGTYPYSGGNAVTYTDPRESEMLLPQRASQRFYILNYMTNFVNTLNSPSFADPVTGYPAYVNVEPSLRNHMVVTLCFSVDAFNFSSYFHKARHGKLTFGPVWDFDRSLESKDDPRDDNPRQFRYVGGWEAFDFFNYSWYGRMFQDTNFWQLWVDRYQEFRHGPLAYTNLTALIDTLTGQIREAQARDVARWPGVTTPRTSFQWEINHMKEWLSNRLEFLDTNFLAMPVLSTAGGRVAPGFTLRITGPATPAGTEVYYTLDGSDPRLPGGGVSPAARLYTGPVTISNNTHVVARSRNLNHRNLTGGASNGNPPVSTPWSGPARAVLVVHDVPLVVTEILYHPAAPLAGSTNVADDFEFIELRNVGPVALSLIGVRFTNGIDYVFTSQSAVTNLAPGGTVILVRDLEAFRQRYPWVTNVAGEFEGTLDNAGERLALVGPMCEPILDFTYRDAWHPITDGPGFSLVVVDAHAPPSAWGEATQWRPGVFGGSPGEAEAAPVAVEPVVINEILARAESPGADAIELHNPSTNTAAIGGWWLTDDFDTPTKYRLPADTLIPPGGYLVLYQSNAFGIGPQGFALGANGEEIYLFSGNAVGELTGYMHGFDFGPQDPGVTFGRHRISTGEDHFPAQRVPTLGAPNAGPLVGPVVISEVHFHPPDIASGGGAADNVAEEYIELYNLSDTVVPLCDPTQPTNAWRLRDAVDFEFPPGAVLVPGGFALVVSFDPGNAGLSNALAARLALPPGVPLFGPYTGKLDNAQDRVELVRPGVLALDGSGQAPQVLVDKVRYEDHAPWPAEADGFGPSLQRRAAADYGNDPANWLAAAPSPGTAYAGGVAPLLLHPPASLTNVAYQDVTLSVEVQSATPLRYQWCFNGMLLAGATNAVLTLSNVQPAQAGEYAVVVWNAAGAVSSAPARLTLLIPPSILVPPTNLMVRIAPDPQAAPTTNATFRVVASSESPLSYQWRFQGVDIPGATNATLTISNVQAGHWGEYSVVVRNDAAALASAPVWLFPLVRPGFAVPPVSQSVAAGSLVTVSALATGWPPPFTFEWRRTTPLIIYASNQVDQPVSFFTLPATNPPGSVVQYRAVLRNPANPSGVVANFTLTALADAEGDGIPDEWWTRHGLTNGIDRFADADGDGLPNGEEYEAGTDPTDPQSSLRLHLWFEGVAPLLSFESRSNKTYSLQYVNGLGSSPWLRIADFVAQTNTVLRVLTNLPPATQGFYRVVTPRQP